jgi:hypothetical protein
METSNTRIVIRNMIAIMVTVMIICETYDKYGARPALYRMGIGGSGKATAA